MLTSRVAEEKATRSGYLLRPLRSRNLNVMMEVALSDMEEKFIVIKCFVLVNIDNY